MILMPEISRHLPSSSAAAEATAATAEAVLASSTPTQFILTPIPIEPEVIRRERAACRRYLLQK